VLKANNVLSVVKISDPRYRLIVNRRAIEVDCSNEFAIDIEAGYAAAETPARDVGELSSPEPHLGIGGEVTRVAGTAATQRIG
jgi:hypothetical protein